MHTVWSAIVIILYERTLLIYKCWCSVDDCAVVCLNPGQKTTGQKTTENANPGQKTTKMVFLWRNLKSPDYVFLFHCIRQWAKKMTLFVAVRLL